MLYLFGHHKRLIPGMPRSEQDIAAVTDHPACFLAFPPVSPADDRRPVASLREHFHEINSHGRLTAAPHSQVTHGYDRAGQPVLPQYTVIKGFIASTDAAGIAPG